MVEKPYFDYSQMLKITPSPRKTDRLLSGVVVVAVYHREIAPVVKLKLYARGSSVVCFASARLRKTYENGTPIWHYGHAIASGSGYNKENAATYDALYDMGYRAPDTGHCWPHIQARNLASVLGYRKTESISIE